MIPDLGELMLYLALAVSVIISLIPILDKAGFKLKFSTLKVLWILKFVLVFFSLLLLIYCYVNSDFSVLNVVYNSHTDKPLIYKISGAWGNHEGSMLLWISSVSFFSMLFAIFGKESHLNKLTLALQGILNTFFIGYTLFLSTPFARVFPPPKNGLGLNPILQDIGLALHPPMLYLGYVGFSVCYSMSVAGILIGKVDKIWAQQMRPWCILSWTFLTMGIALGSWWAYRELGWGGYWFWDPVENASLMPWLSATAMIHALIAYEKTSQMKNWSVLLSLTTFMLSLLGTFLVRSGIVTSVHSFAHDPERGVFILGFIVFITIISFCVYTFKISFSQLSSHRLLSRITFLNFNNLFLTTATCTVVIGTFYPMLLEILTGQKISVGHPYFNKMIGPISVALALICASGTPLSWLGKKKEGVKKFFFENGILAAISAFFTFLLWIIFNVDNAFALAGIFSGLLVIISMLKALIGKIKNSHLRIIDGFFSMFFAHLGFGVLMVAISINFALENEKTKVMKKGQGADFVGYEISLYDIEYTKHSNYISQAAKMHLYKSGELRAILLPEIKFFDVEKQQTIESSIMRMPFYDLYLTIDGIYDENNGVTVRMFYKPMMGWIWFSALLFSFAGAHALSTFIARRAFRKKA